MDYIYSVGMLLAALIFGYAIHTKIDKKISEEKNHFDDKRNTEQQ